jgi:anti-anti-sigma factor
VTARGTIDVEVHSYTAAVVTLYGEHDLGSAGRVSIALAVAGDCPNILVDLSHCTFIDSSVINAFLRAANRMRGYGGRLELVVPPPVHPLRSVLELMSLESLLPRHDSRAAGIASVERRTARRRTKSMRIGALVELVEMSAAELEARRRSA